MLWSRLSSRLPGSTRRPGADADLGGFGALFDLKAAGFRDPILVASNDGVGTKLKIAIDTGRHATIGIDLVAMCVNDLLAQGAEPLFFLDYFACGKLEVETARSVIAGIAEGCRQAGCALIGGETAEMPGHVCGRGLRPCRLLRRRRRARRAAAPPGHRGGRRADRPALLGRAFQRLFPGAPAGGRGQRWRGMRRRRSLPAISLAEALLVPTRIYVRPALKAIRDTGAVKGLAHITGGGLSENLPRILPAGLAAHVDLAGWHAPAVFGWLQQVGNLDDAEMLRTFNCGIGLVIVAAQGTAEAVVSVLQAAGEAPILIGDIEPGRGVKSSAKGKGEAEAVRYSGKLRLAE